MNDYPWRLQIIYSAVLSLILVLVFFPISIGWKIIGLILILSIASVLFYYQLRYRKRLNACTKNINFLAQKLSLLPARQRYRLPILLVTGNCAKQFFPEDLTLAESNIIVSSDAVWVYVEEYSELPIVFDSLVARWPDMLGRIGLLLATTPELENKQGLYTAKLQSFRQSWVDTCRIAKYRLPVYVSAHIGLNNIHYHDEGTLPVNWYQIISRQLYIMDEYLSPVDNWVNDKKLGSKERQQRLSIRAMLREYEKWINTHILSVLTNSKQTIAKCEPEGVAIYPLNSQVLSDNLFNHQINKLTTLTIPNHHSLQEILTPPDQLVKYMPIAYPYSPLRKAICNMIMITSVFFMAGLGASYWNNIKLAQQIDNDIHNYDLIATDSYDEKYKALEILKADRDLLNDHYTQGIPVRLGLGLYHGYNLLEPLNQAIGRYVPPPPPPEPKPEPETIIVKEKEIVIKEYPVIRLDSLSLFESGKATLKPESTKVLINALMEIKTQVKLNNDVGWLILISGHTDSTGDANKNQQLSLDRAAAVRDWIIKTSDIPETCFAIQGYGAKKPLVSNDTLENRSQNRRVEINLVPQITTCQLIDEN